MLVLCILAVVLYLVCAVIMYGLEFAYWQNLSPISVNADYIDDMFASIFFGLFWIVLIIDKGVRKDLMKSFKENGLKFY